MGAFGRHLFRFIAVFAAAFAFAGGASASFHDFRIEQIFSNADGTVQFVVLHESFGANGEQFLSGHQLKATHAGVTNTFTFPHDLPSSATAGRRALIATHGFAALGIVTPDYEIPNGFLPTGSGTLNYADVDIVGYGSLPTDGVTAINQQWHPDHEHRHQFRRPIGVGDPGAAASGFRQFPGAVVERPGWFGARVGDQSQSPGRHDLRDLVHVRTRPASRCGWWRR